MRRLVEVLRGAADLALVAAASGSTDLDRDPLLVLPDTVQLLLLENGPYVLVWFCGMANFGISPHHLVPWRSVDRTEELLQQWGKKGKKVAPSNASV